MVRWNPPTLRRRVLDELALSVWREDVATWAMFIMCLRSAELSFSELLDAWQRVGDVARRSALSLATPLPVTVRRDLMRLVDELSWKLFQCLQIVSSVLRVKCGPHEIRQIVTGLKLFLAKVEL